MYTLTKAQQRATQLHNNYKPHNKPFHLQWQGRDYQIAGVTSYHTELNGSEPLHVFIVNSGPDKFELRFTNEEVEWFLG